MPAEQAAWENFLATAPIVGGGPGVDVAYAVGIDTEVTDGDLAPIAWAPGNPNLPPVIIENAADLSVALQGSLPGNPSGNVLSNDGYGADGGYIKSVTIEGTTYTYDPTTHTITWTGTTPGVGDVINPNGMQVTVMTAIGGRIIFNFDANGLNQAGDWDYLAPASGIDNTASIEQFTYVLVDGDGDGDSAVLKIKVEPSPVPSIILGDAADQTVDEAGLPARAGESEGSAAATNSEAASGTFIIQSTDALLQITIAPDAPNNVPVVIPVAALLTSGVTPIVIQTVEGNLVINGYNPGTGAVSYTYTLEDNQDHSGGSVTDVFTITATDVNNDTSPPFSLPITIVDDVPTAVADTDSVVEGAAATGNVITDVEADGGKDTQGADSAIVTAIQSNNLAGPVTPVPGGGLVINGQYGQLTINPDGSYSYVANGNISNAAAVTDIFTYTLTDGDNDATTTTLTITIADGTNPSVLRDVTIPVDEEGLLNANAVGTNPSSPAEANTGAVLFQAGSDNIVSVAFGSTAGITAEVNGVAPVDVVWSANGANQILGTINGITAIQIDLAPLGGPIAAGGTGAAMVTVTLLDNFPHVNANGENVITLNGITVVATDTDLDTVAANVTVTVKDDVPQANVIIDFDDIVLGRWRRDGTGLALSGL